MRTRISIKRHPSQFEILQRQMNLLQKQVKNLAEYVVDTPAVRALRAEKVELLQQLNEAREHNAVLQGDIEAMERQLMDIRRPAVTYLGDSGGVGWLSGWREDE